MSLTKTAATRVLTAMAVLATSGACGDLGPGDGPFEELTRNQERWQQQRPATYQYGVERLCFCGVEARGPVRVTVTGDDVTDRSYIDTGEPVPALFEDLFPTVDGLFDVLRDAIEREAHRIDVTYDPISGVPLDLFIDYEQNVADEELGFRVVEVVGPPPMP
jgi:hypothetical protein